MKHIMVILLLQIYKYIVNFFLEEEFCGDIDASYSSFYITKKRNNDKFYFGPVWDFDLAFDNDNRLYPTNDKPNFVFNYGWLAIEQWLILLKC